jgi:hypothetical protein
LAPVNNKRALQLFAPTGVPLESAVAQFAETTSILGKASVVESAKFFDRWNSGVPPKKSVREVVHEFIAGKHAKGKSERYLSHHEKVLRDRGYQTAAQGPFAVLRLIADFDLQSPVLTESEPLLLL